MARWLWVTIAISLIAAAAAAASADADTNDIWTNILEVIKSLMPLIKGGLKFLVDIIEFSEGELSDSTPKNQEEYDFIIVGAGSAGSVIASRLSETQAAKILLIEAGNVEHLILDVPLLAVHVQFDKNVHWDYLNEPSNNSCLAFENKQCKIPVGKAMGGTSVLNFMMATRGNRDNYDRWAAETGDQGWSYDSMLKYFKKLERFEATLGKIDREFHDVNGPVRIGNVPYHTPLVDSFIEAGREMGFDAPNDYNGRRQTGFSYLQTNQINGERLSANRAYLHPAKNRKNLIVSMHSHVDRILIDPDTKTAYGVEFTKSNRKIKVRARKEVILAAGAIGSPKLLMLSGIGPEEHLKSFNIGVLKDAPVGKNLMDHIGYGGLTFLVNDTEGVVASEFLSFSNPALSDYLTKRNGPLSLPIGIQGVGYVNVDDPSAENETPNVELVLASVHFGADYLLHLAFGMREDYFQKSFSPTLNKHGYLIWPILIQPKSRGRVLLRSANPKDKPLIIGNYFSHPDDIRVAVKSIRIAIEVAKTNAMKKHGSQLHEFTVPGCENFVPNSDGYWECAFRTFTMTVWHHSGTCKMGKEDDPLAVVNSNLQVKGVKNLRVADASIMPMIPTAHLNIPSMAIGERASDIIKSAWK